MPLRRVQEWPRHEPLPLFTETSSEYPQAAFQGLARRLGGRRIPGLRVGRTVLFLIRGEGVRGRPAAAAAETTMGGHVWLGRRLREVDAVLMGQFEDRRLRTPRISAFSVAKEEMGYHGEMMILFR